MKNKNDIRLAAASLEKLVRTLSGTPDFTEDAAFARELQMYIDSGCHFLPLKPTSLDDE
jgi:hypothetical protein